MCCHSAFTEELHVLLCPHCRKTIQSPVSFLWEGFPGKAWMLVVSGYGAKGRRTEEFRTMGFILHGFPGSGVQEGLSRVVRAQAQS